MKKNKQKIIIFSGGTGTQKLTKKFLKKYNEFYFEINYLINCYDNGKSTGEMRKIFDYKILGSSDIRKLHEVQYNFLNKNNRSNFFSKRINIKSIKQLNNLKEYSFIKNAPNQLLKIIDECTNIFINKIKNKNIDYTNISFANIIYSSLAYKLKSMQKSEEIIRKVFKLPFKVLINSEQILFLSALSKNNVIINGENNIVEYKNKTPIKDIFFTSKPLDNNKLKEIKIKNNFFKKIFNKTPSLSLELKNQIKNSDIIIYGPGTQFSSLYPTYLSNGLENCILKSKAKKLYICNSTKDNDTPQFSQNQQIKSSIYFIKKRKKNINLYNKYIDLLFIIKKNINIKNYLNYNENDLKKLHIKNIIKSSSENTNSIVVTESLQNCSKNEF